MLLSELNIELGYVTMKLHLALTLPCRLNMGNVSQHAKDVANIS